MCAVPSAGAVNHEKELAARQELVIGEILTTWKRSGMQARPLLSDGVFSFKFFQHCN